MSIKQAKGRWRGLNLDEQIKTALRDRLSEDRFGIDSNPVYRKLAPSSKPQYAAMIEVWKACVVDLTKSSLEYQSTNTSKVLKDIPTQTRTYAT
jgi:hypothetical protein